MVSEETSISPFAARYFHLSKTAFLAVVCIFTEFSEIIPLFYRTFISVFRDIQFSIYFFLGIVASKSSLSFALLRLKLILCSSYCQHRAWLTIFFSMFVFYIFDQHVFPQYSFLYINMFYFLKIIFITLLKCLVRFSGPKPYLYFLKQCS